MILCASAKFENCTSCLIPVSSIFQRKCHTYEYKSLHFPFCSDAFVCSWRGDFLKGIVIITDHLFMLLFWAKFDQITNSGTRSLSVELWIIGFQCFLAFHYISNTRDEEGKFETNYLTHAHSLFRTDLLREALKLIKI